MRKTQFFLPLLLIVISGTDAFNQHLNWAFDIGGAGVGTEDQAYAIARDASGNLYTTGTFEGTVDFDPSGATTDLISNGNEDIFVAKYNSSGGLVWAFNIGGVGDDLALGITLDGSDNVYVTGHFTGMDIDFDPDMSASFLLTSSSNGSSKDIFVAKYTSGGIFDNAFNIGGTGEDIGYGIATDGSNNVYVTGSFNGLDVDFDPGAGMANLSSSGGRDIFVAKYNSSGAYQWAFELGSASDDVGWDIETDASSNVYVTGYFQGTDVDFDPGVSVANLTSSGNEDIFVAKYDTDGAYQNAFKIGGTGDEFGSAISIDGSNNICITGRFTGAVDFDPGVGTASFSSNGGRDIFVAKYNSSGSYQWAFNIGGASNDIGYGIATDASGNVYATGDFTGTVDFDPSGSTANLTSNGSADIFVVKYNSSGVYQGSFNVGGSSDDLGTDIEVDNTGQAYVTGYFSDTSVDFDPDPNTTTNLSTSATGDYDFFVTCYKPEALNLPVASADFNWAFSAGSAGVGTEDQSYAIDRDASGNIYITGTFEGTVDFDPSTGTANLTSNGNEDIFVAKYDSDGLFQWAFKIGGTADDLGFGITVDGSSNVYVTGHFQGANVDFDPNGGTANLSSNGVQDVFVAKYSSSGTYLNAFNIGGTGEDIGYNVATDGSDNVYVSGYFNGSNVDFDPDAGMSNLSSNGGRDIFVAKYSSAGAHEWSFNIGGTVDDASWDLDLDGLDNVWVTGYFEGTDIDFDPNAGTANLTSNGMEDIFVAKYNSSGTYLNAFGIGGTGDEFASAIAIDASNNVFITGRFTGAVDFDPSAGVSSYSSNGGRDIFLAKYNNAGTFKWAFNIGGASNDLGYGITTDGSSVYVTGDFTGTVDFDPSGATENLTSNGSADIFVAKYTNGGSYVGAFNVGGTSDDLGADIVVDNSGEACVTGYFQGSNVDFDPDPATTFNLSSSAIGDYDLFVASYKPDALGISLPVELTDFQVRAMDGKAHLEWQTASEFNNFGFHIEWSTNNRNWEEIDFVFGNGDSFEKHSYAFIHENPRVGINYYRLKQVDYDGVFEYSDVVSVQLAVGSWQLAVHPNPVQNGELTLYIPDETFENATLEIFNTVGQLVQAELLTHSESTLRLDDFPTGVYLFSLTMGRQRVVERVMVK